MFIYYIIIHDKSNNHPLELLSIKKPFQTLLGGFLASNQGLFRPAERMLTPQSVTAQTLIQILLVQDGGQLTVRLQIRGKRVLQQHEDVLVKLSYDTPTKHNYI
jgi:hypothetical protein